MPRWIRSKAERFLARAVQRDNGCMDFEGPVAANGYGRHGAIWAHRLAYEIAYGPIPSGLHIDHACANRRCVRPEHLEAVTQQENNRRQRQRSGPARLCKRGHAFTPGNTYVTGGQRVCRECHRARQKAFRLTRRTSA